jgi:hypothetical protein
VVTVEPVATSAVAPVVVVASVALPEQAVSASNAATAAMRPWGTR